LSNENDLLEVLNKIEDSVVALDSDCAVIYVNKAYANIFGFQPSDMIGQNIWKLLPKTADSIIHSKIIEALKKRKFQHFEWRGIYVDVFWETTIFPNGRGVTVVTRDITKRKQSDASLISSNQRLELILSISNQLLSNTDPQTLIEGICQKVTAFLNCAVFFNYLVDNKDPQRLHLNAYSGVSPEVAKSLEWLQLGQLACGYAIKEGKRIIWENMFSSNEERIALLRDSGVRVYVANPFFSRGKAIGCLSFGSKLKDAFSAEEYSFIAAVAAQVGVAMDRKRAQDALVRAKDELTVTLEKSIAEKTEQLREAERLATIGATAGMVGHDIRNPLQAIMCDAYILREEIVNMPKSKLKEGITESIDSIEKNITYINKIVADLQDYARPIRAEYLKIILLELVTGVFTPIVIPENIKANIEVDPAFELKSDPVLLRRILTNLINNAIQAMPKGGHLTVSSRRNDGEVLLYVEDTGIGIPEAVKPRLFTPMFTTKAKGQGFGLAVVKRLVEALNGSVTFESEEGKGTKFIVTIPEGS
jgi:PAS domain S-box-containing protein